MKSIFVSDDSIFNYYAALLVIYLIFFHKQIITFFRLKIASHEGKKDFLIPIFLFFLASLLASIYANFIFKNNLSGLLYPPTLIIKNYPALEFLEPFFPYGLFYGTVVSLNFILFRATGLSRSTCVVLTFIVMISANHLHNLIPSPFRDYAKAPFILLIVILLVSVGRQILSGIHFFHLSFWTSITLGAGMIVRQDLIVFLLPIFIVWTFFLRSRSGSFMKSRIFGAIVLLLIIFPHFIIPKKSEPIRIVAGLVTHFDHQLGLNRNVYDRGFLFMDEYLRSYPKGEYIQSHPNQKISTTPDEMNVIYSEFFLKNLQYFPADSLIRFWGSVFQVFGLPFKYGLPPQGVKSTVITGLYAVKAKVFDFLSTIFLYISLAALAISLIQRLRFTLLWVFLIIFLGAYPVIQFQGRHFFHLEFIGLWLTGFLLEQIVCSIKKIIQNRRVYA